MTGEKKGSKEKEGRTCVAPRHGIKPCGRPLFDNKHCIFHSKNIEKKKRIFNDAFQKEFERQKKHEEIYDFEGFVFPGDISFRGKEFEKEVNFKEAQFSGEADFWKTQFSGEAVFWIAQFSGKAVFLKAQFSGKAFFNHAQFSSKVYFKEAQFFGEADFGGAQFSGEADFGGAQFSGKAYFWGAQFTGKVEFNEAKFLGAEFREGPTFSNAKFFENVYFSNAQISGEASFAETKFSGYTGFTGVQFSGRAFFDHAQFFRITKFRQAQFFQEAFFRYVVFSGEADFSSAKFLWKGVFNGAQFSGRADFKSAEFYVGNDNLDGAIDGYDTPITQLPVKVSAEKYRVGMKIIVGTNDNAGNGFKITAINVLKKTLTISPGVNDVQPDYAVVRGLIPAAENSTANFSHTKFSKFADFGEAQFGGQVNFTGAEFFEDANFNLFRFHGKIIFREVKFHKRADFQNIIADEDVNNLSFEYTYVFSEKGLFDFIKNNKEKFNYSKKTKLEFLPDNFNLILGEEVAARDPTTTRKIRDDMFLLKFREEHPNWFRIWWLFADCGRSFFRWAMWSLGLSLFFGMLWLILGGDYFSFNPEKNITWLSYFYYSFVTFTTLGFGDIIPTNWISETLVTIEVIFGYIMLGGLISILANKMARRS